MSCGADAGQLTERISFKVRAAGQDALGQANGAWSVYVTVWASAKPMTGREQFRAGQLTGIGPVTFRLRYRTDINERMCVEWRGEDYEITAPPIDVDGGRSVLEVLCAKGLRDGRPDVE